MGLATILLDVPFSFSSTHISLLRENTCLLGYDTLQSFIYPEYLPGIIYVLPNTSIRNSKNVLKYVFKKFRSRSNAVYTEEALTVLEVLSANV